MPLNRSLSAFTAAVAVVLITAPATALGAEFPDGFPHITKPKPTGEDTPLSLDTSEKAADHVTSGGGGGGLVRTIVGLAVVIGVIYGLTWVLKQVKTSRETKSAGPGLENIASVSLGPNRALHLVRSGREIVLVGAAEQGVTPIRVYSMEEARRLGLLEEDSDPAITLGEAEVVAERKPGEIPRAPRQLPGPPAETPAPHQRPAPKGPDLTAFVRRAQQWTVRG